MNDRSLDSTELSEELRQLVRETEITGRRTIFSRNNKPIAILVSHDEYMALRETIDLSSQSAILADIVESENQAKNGSLILPEDLFVE